MSQNFWSRLTGTILRRFYIGNANIGAALDASSLTTSRTFNFPDLGGTFALLQAANVFTGGPNIFIPSNSSSSTAILRGTSGQSVPIALVEDFNGSVLSEANPDGTWTINGGRYTTINGLISPAGPSITTGSGGSFGAGTYFWTITATNAVDEAAHGSQVSHTMTAGQVANLSWAQAVGATGYNIYRSTSSGVFGPTALVATITNGTQITFTDTGASPTTGTAPTTSVGVQLLINQAVGQTNNPIQLFSSGLADLFHVTAAGALAVVSTISASNFSGSSSGTNTGDQTITLTGNVTGSGTGSFATTIAAGVVTNANLAGSIAASKLVGTDIATVGTITTGTWQATAIDAQHGGTGQTTWTLGDLLYSSAANVLSKLTGNTTATKKFLRQTGTGSVSAAPAWDTLAAVDMPAFSGDVSTTAGTTTTAIGTGKVTAAMLAGSIPASKLTATDIATVGTITTGIWNGTAIAVLNGGTGQTSYTNGQLLIGNTTGNTLAKTTLTQGTGITITNGAGSITVASSVVAPVAAVKLDQTTGTSTTVFVNPAVQQNHISAAKAWCYFTVGPTPTFTVTIQASFNIASVVRAGVGIYTITFTNAMADANYIVIPVSDNLSGTGDLITNMRSTSTKSTTSFQITVSMTISVTNIDPTGCNILIYGNQ